MKINVITISLYFLTMLLYSNNSIYAQDSTKTKQLSFKITFSPYKNTDFYFGSGLRDDFDKKVSVGNIKITSNLKFNKYLETGIYLGYSLYETYAPDPSSTKYDFGGSFEFANALMYGLNADFHILPLFINERKFRFDPYISGQIGGIHLFEDDKNINNKHNFVEYGIYGGLAFYPFKHLGVFTEYGYSKYTPFKLGVCWR